MGDGEPERSFEDPPPVILWFKVYASLVGLGALGAAVAIPYLLFLRPARRDSTLLAVALGVPSLVVFLGCLVPLVVRPRPWVWTYGFVLILLAFPASCGLGLLSVAILALCIPLLVYWLRPETKRWYGKKD